MKTIERSEVAGRFILSKKSLWITSFTIMLLLTPFWTISISSIKANLSKDIYEPSSGAYIGAFIVNDQVVMGDIRTFESMTGKKHASYFTYSGYGNPFPWDWVNMVKAHGAVPQLAWEPHGGLDQIQNDTYLHNWAKEAKKAGPFFLRFMCEMNGAWVPWYTTNYTKYIEKWRLVYNVFQQEGATNVAFIWAPNWSPANYNNWYPGDDYVDWVGVDFYSVHHHNYWPYPMDNTDPRDKLRGVYNNYSDRKPIAIAEWAAAHQCNVTGGLHDTANYSIDHMNKLYNNLESEFPRVKFVNWFDMNAILYGKTRNYCITDNATVLNNYKSAISDSWYLSAVEHSGKTGSKVSISTNASSLVLGEKVTISGNLTDARTGNALSGKTITLSYSWSYTSWNTIANVQTEPDGSYSYTWTASVSGALNIRAYWSGNTSYTDASYICPINVEFAVSWGAENPLPSTDITNQMDIMQLPNGTIVVAYAQMTPGYVWYLAYKYSSDYGNTWSDQKNIPGVGALTWCVRPSLVMAKNGSLLLIYCTLDGPGGNSIEYKKCISLVNNIWSEEKTILTGLSGANEHMPDATVLKNGDILVAFHSKRGGRTGEDIWYMRSTDNGETWTSPNIIYTDGPDYDVSDQLPTIAQACDGTLVCVWSQTSGGGWDLRWSKSSDGGTTWTFQGVLTTGGPNVAARLRRALEGGLILVWNTQRESDAKISIYMKTMDQSGWQGDQHVAGGTDNDRIRPSVAQVFGGTNDKKIIVVYRNDVDKKVYFKWSNEGPDIVKKGTVYTEFNLLTLYRAHFEINGNFCIGVGMVVMFYSYLGDYQAESTIWTGITPANITLSVNVSHPLGKPIEKAMLVMTDGGGGNILSTIASFLVYRSDLMERLTLIDGRWPFVSPSERMTLFREIVDIDMQWPYAPP